MASPSFISAYSTCNSSRLTTTTTEFYQPAPEASTSNFISSQENPFSAMKVNIESTTNNFSNPFMAQPSMTILSEQMKRDDLAELNGAMLGNGYQKLPFHLPPSSTYDTDAVDHQLTAKLNRMLYTQSPQLPRKTYEFNANTANIIQQTNIPSQLSQQPTQLHHQPLQIHPPQQPLQMQFHQPSHVNPPHLHQAPQLHHIGNQSPYMARKFAHNEPEYGTHYSPYKPLPLPQQQQPQSTFSPVIRKRYQEGHLVSEDLEFRILHGNTSPIVLQRFYHQQNQLKDQKEEDQLRAIRMQSSSPNPFKSSIPVRNDGSPLLNPRFQHQQAQMLQRNVLHHEPTYNASHKIHESHIPQLQSRMVANGNGIPFRHQHQQQQPMPQHHPYQPMYDNVAHRAQIACPGSPQLDRLRANLEKPNFYERHQKLPVEIESYQLDSSMNQSNGLNMDSKNKDKGMLGMQLIVVDPRFLSMAPCHCCIMPRVAPPSMTTPDVQNIFV